MFLLGFLLLFGAYFLLAPQKIQTAEASSVVPHYGDRDYRTDTPIYIRFRSGTEHAKFYNRLSGIQNRFYERVNKAGTHYYSLTPPQNATAKQRFYGNLLENRQTQIGKGGMYLVNTSKCKGSVPYRLNLKTGASIKDVYQGYNSGNYLITDGCFIGKYHEWRYLGYTSAGQAVNNPTFPADSYAGTVWSRANWVPINEVWKSHWLTDRFNLHRTEHDRQSYNKRLNWTARLVEDNPQLRRSGESVSQAARRLVPVFSWRTSPDRELGVAVGVHINNGRYWYVQFMVRSPKPNLRLTNFTVRDADTNAIIGRVKRSTNNNNKTVTTTYSKDTVYPGKKYRLTGTIRNMNIKGMKTTHARGKVAADRLISFDETISESGRYSSISKNACTPTSPSSRINYNSSVTVSCDYTLSAKTTRSNIEFGMRIPIHFYNDGYNTDTSDDESSLIFKISEEDMKLTDTVEIINSKGKVVNHVNPNEMYSVRVYVNKNKGDKAVQNPTVNLTVDDGATIEHNITAKGSKLTKGKTVAVTFKNAIRPKTSTINIKAEISNVHDNRGENIRINADDRKTRTFYSEVDISANNFKVTPSNIYFTSNEVGTARRDLSFFFNIRNDNPSNQGKAVPFVIRQGSNVIYTDKVDVPANKNVPISVTIPNVLLSESASRTTFSVEVNPVPRLQFESLRNGNPYANNTRTATVTLHDTTVDESIPLCQSPNRENTWTTTHTVTTWNSSSSNAYGQSDTSSMSVTKVTRNYYERYSVEKVLFKSKLTEDQGLGWVDITNQPGKVKAGYGFDLRFITRYTTNVMDVSPKPFYGENSYRTVEPLPSKVEPANRIALKAQFPGNSQTWIMNGSPSGSWTNMTHSYQLPTRIVDGRATKQIFIDKNVKDGIYTMTVETAPFVGQQMKPNPAASGNILCDLKTVRIEVVGDRVDDLNTHINQ